MTFTIRNIFAAYLAPRAWIVELLAEACIDSTSIPCGEHRAW